MHGQDISIRFNKEMGWDGAGVYIIRRDHEANKIHIAQNIEFGEGLDPYSYLEPGDPTIRLYGPDGTMQLQRIMDDLWDMRIRPSDEGSIGQVQAISAHLRDMRALVAHFTEAKL